LGFAGISGTYKALGASRPIHAVARPELDRRGSQDRSTSVAPEVLQAWLDEHGSKVKKRVALHIGYVGTGLRGLQIQRASPGLTETVEHFLEEALYAAGGVDPRNLRQMGRLNWSRSSRTDKGVHSLCTIISLKMLVEDGRLDGLNADAWESDSLAISDAINRHLPREIRVFQCAKVTKSFQARRAARTRTYDYYLPTTVLGLESPGAPTAADEEKLSLLRKAVGVYQGRHPFHNFTTMRLYAKEGARGGGKDTPIDEDDDGDDEDMGEGVGGGDVEAAPPAPTAPWEWGTFLTDASGLQPRQLVSTAHFRRVESFTCGAPAQVGDGSEGGLLAAEEPGAWFVRLSVTGESFMMKQIRHMVGGAVAVANGHMPLDVLRAALAVPARVSLPLAPPHTLVLAATEFHPYRAPPGRTPGSKQDRKYSALGRDKSRQRAPTRTDGDTLELGKGGGTLQV